MSLKEDGETWSFIAEVLGIGKKRAQRRFKKLTRKLKSTTTQSRKKNYHSKRSQDEESDVTRQLYVESQIKENLHPPYLGFKPGSHFTKRDCEVLSSMDSKMKRGKWLEMQANFFNATGKMLPLSVFRDRCEAAEAEQYAVMRDDKISTWMAGLDQHKQLDPFESSDRGTILS